MAGKTTSVLLVTANVGSIFEDPSVMLKIWTEEFLSTVARLDPKFVALHCQEVGGKNYERSMKHVEYFVRLLMSSEELRLFDKVRVYLDEDYSSAENFTALGNFYFIHESISDVLIWDFAAMSFVPAKGKDVHSGNIEAVSTKEKSKFPQDFFPECKWSRKGFLRTRWNLDGTVFDLINIHLFHDASNFIAMESFPSVYCKNRRRALEHTLERFHNDEYGIAPFFVFGDFNFRTDTQGVIKKLTDDLNPVRVQSNKNSDHTKMQYRDGTSQVILSLGKKEFSHVDHQTVFIGNDGKWLKEFDRELEPFTGRLFEFSIAFPPSYPFEEDEKGANRYMQTRCPSWCDRVILSSTAKSLVNNISEPGSVEYGLMGEGTCMGDHKPVYLKAELLADAGTVSCCTHGSESSPCFGRVSPCWSCSKSLKATVFVTESPALTLSLNTSYADSAFLAPPHAALLHEPYTPESMETPSSSPTPVRVQRDFGEAEIEVWQPDTTNVEKTESKETKKRSSSQNKIGQLQMLINQDVIVNITPSTADVVQDMPFIPTLTSPKSVLENETVLLHDELLPRKERSNPFNFNTAMSTVVLNIPYLKVPVKRVQSASTVESSSIDNMAGESGVRTCRCFSDSWRRKTVPTLALQNVGSSSRVRLISSCDMNSSPRLQSHHSSSEEDWFEEIECDSNKIVPIKNSNDDPSGPYNDDFIINSQKLNSETIALEYQNQAHIPAIPVVHSGETFLVPSVDSSVLVSHLDTSQEMDTEDMLIAVKTSCVQRSESNLLNKNDSTCEIQSFKDLKKSSEQRDASSHGSIDNQHKINRERISSQRSETSSIASMESIVLSVTNDSAITNQVICSKNDNSISLKKNVLKKKRKSNSDKKMNHCCVMI